MCPTLLPKILDLKQSCVTLVRSLSFSEPWFPHLYRWGAVMPTSLPPTGSRPPPWSRPPSSLAWGCLTLDPPAQVFFNSAARVPKTISRMESLSCLKFSPHSSPWHTRSGPGPHLLFPYFLSLFPPKLSLHAPFCLQALDLAGYCSLNTEFSVVSNR